MNTDHSIAITISGEDGYMAQGCLRKSDFETLKSFLEQRWLKYGELSYDEYQDKTNPR